jgi:hypothetical protein
MKISDLKDNKLIRLHVGEEIYRIEGTAIITDEGLVFTIFGGEKSHIGTVVMTLPRPSHLNQNKISTTSSILNNIGHKDDVIARDASEKMAKKFEIPTVVVAGIHIDDASKEDIDTLMKNANKITEKMIKKLENIPI